MEGTEKRIEKRFGLAEFIRDLRENSPYAEQNSITYTGSCARAEGKPVRHSGPADPLDEQPKPVWQEPSKAGSYNTITRPAHYARFPIQPIDFIEANDLDFHQASVLKYLVRFPFKNGLEDLHKARNMLDRLIAREEKRLVRDAGKEVAGEPATDYAEDSTDRRDGSK